MVEVHKCTETLKKSCTELKYEAELIKSLFELVEFMDSTVKYLKKFTAI